MDLLYSAFLSLKQMCRLSELQKLVGARGSSEFCAMLSVIKWPLFSPSPDPGVAPEAAGSVADKQTTKRRPE